MKSLDTLTRGGTDFDDCNLADNVTESTRLTVGPERHLSIVNETDEQETSLSMDESEVKVEDGHKVQEGHGHNHGHGHGHSHEVPDSIAAVAWMVILGDGLHNFSDGLAIGAAFAQGISGGISTAVAVFCHELPHELGDFAVLLKTGMKVKQALFYNMVSSLLCFVGMLIGIALGNVQEASYWIFAIAGGMFIYIALVDMLPELSSANAKAGENKCIHFFLHNAGLLTGISIMLVIALYEETIKEYLDSEFEKVAEPSIKNATIT